MTLGKCIEKLYEGGYRCVAADREGFLFTSDGRGMEPMLQLLKGFEEGWEPLFLADRIIGRAAALVAAHCGVKEIYGDLVSESAAEITEECGIALSWRERVPMILNREKTGEGPFEAALRDVDDGNFPEVVRTIERVAAEMRRKRAETQAGK